MSVESRVYNLPEELEDLVKICILKKERDLRIRLTSLTSESILVETSCKKFSVLGDMMKSLRIHKISDVSDFYAFYGFVKERYPRFNIYDVTDILHSSIDRILYEDIDYLEDVKDIYYIQSDEDIDIDEFRKRWKEYYFSQISRICETEGHSYLWHILTKFGLKHRGEIKRIGNLYEVEILHDNPEFINPFNVRIDDIKVISLEKEITSREALAILYINRKYKGELFPIVGTRDILIKGGIEKVIIPIYKKRGFTKDDVDVFTTDSFSDLSVLETWSLIRIGQNTISSIFDLYLYECECKESKKPLTNPINRSPIPSSVVKSIVEKVKHIQQHVGKSYMNGFEPEALPKLDMSPLIYNRVSFSISRIPIYTTTRSDERVICYLLTQSDRPENLFSAFGQRKLSYGYPFQMNYLSPNIRTIIDRPSNIFGEIISTLLEIESYDI